MKLIFAIVAAIIVLGLMVLSWFASGTYKAALIVLAIVLGLAGGLELIEHYAPKSALGKFGKRIFTPLKKFLEEAISHF